MLFRSKHPYGPIAPGALAAFEKALAPRRLPDELRSFLIEFNGGECIDARNEDEMDDERMLGDMFGLHQGPTYLRLDSALTTFARLLPAHLLVFADDGCGNYFAIALAEPQLGAIYFVDHEALPAKLKDLRVVAPSLTAFLGDGDVVVEESPPATSLAAAFEAGSRSEVLRLLAEGASAAGFTHRAVRHGDASLIEPILDAGGQVDELNSLGETPLFAAAQGRADIAQLLLARGANVNHRCNADGTALEMAEHSPDVARVLVRAGAESDRPRLRELIRRLLGAG